jgi:hypothetical protein
MSPDQLSLLDTAAPASADPGEADPSEPENLLVEGQPRAAAWRGCW